MIPKKIHYCWYGGGPQSDLIQKCIASWKKILPNYEIICWDESNTPFDSIPVLKTMYKNKKWSFISDYIRFYALYHFGGVYLDTDIEMIKPFGDLMQEEAFIGFQTEIGQSKFLSNAAVMGSISTGSFVKHCLKATESKQRLKFNQIGGPAIVSDYFVLSRVTKHQNQYVGQVKLLTKDYFYPFYHRIESFSKDCITPNTVCIHWWADSWSEKKRTLSYKVNSALSKAKRIPQMTIDWLKFVCTPSLFYQGLKYKPHNGRKI